MSFIRSSGMTDANIPLYLPTGTLLDSITGKFVPDGQGGWIKDGGIPTTFGVQGRENQFKSTLLCGAAVNAAVRLPHSEIIIYDSERSLNKARIVRAHNLYMDDPELRAKIDTEMLGDADNPGRLIITNDTEIGTMEEWYEHLRPFIQERINHIKDYLVETPHIDVRTGKKRLMPIPILLGIDSMTMAKVLSAEAMLDKTNASDSKTNTYYMKVGLQKKKILDQMITLCARAGMYLFASVHVGDKPSIDGGPVAKEMQHMKQGDAIKGAGSSYLFLISTEVEVRGAHTLEGGNKDCLYGLGEGHITSPTEMTGVTNIVIRGKGNQSGQKSEMVLSQTNGMEVGLWNYHYLRETCKYEGLVGGNTTHRPILRPDVSMNRNTARQKMLDYRTFRAMEIVTELMYVQRNWTIPTGDVPYNIDVTAFADGLLTKSGGAINDILDSRGWWTYGDHPRQYLSLPDIIRISTGQYKPKLLGYTPSKNLPTAVYGSKAK